MTASSTRFCRRSSWLAAFAALVVAAAAALPARADGIEVRKAALITAEDGYFLEAEFDIALTHTLEEALNKGVPLYFTLEFELIRPRWYWLNEKLANARQQYRLSYNALTRHYRVGVGRLYQNFGTLSEALSFLSQVRLRDFAEPGALGKGASYTAALRLRLDTSQLPRPFQISAVGSREWTISSDWHRWTVSP
ncbi:MAG: hypothetical protein A3I02_02425 [Betaproteobacteria bacterium RIFCSPLOWO2_02_FULL_67_26]|nr:MAG: hypothetical protein A3I02_02425 [Betaproteobacteria bacterium RIFCSPLOWO2_02_FULL_67_26]